MSAAGGAVPGPFDLAGRVAVITGGAGMLGMEHAQAIAGAGGVPVLLDIDQDALQQRVVELAEAHHGPPADGHVVDITQPQEVAATLGNILANHGRVDILINNAANNPKVEGTRGGTPWSRLEAFPFEIWQQDLAVGLTGAFLCAQAFGSEMARRGGGVILNVASDLALIGPDQRIYRRPGLAPDEQPAKPVTYSVVKSGLLGLTRYLATYWAERGVRANSISPGGVRADQDEAFVSRLSELIPLGRMARRDEYRATVLFLVSDASSYMTGANLVIDGGRTAW